MGGASRESYRVFSRPYNWRAVLRWRTWRYAYSRRLVLRDNFGPLVCAVFGHKPYNTSTIYEKPEHACSYCYQWLRHLDPVDWVPSPEIARLNAANANAKVSSFRVN